MAVNCKSPPYIGTHGTTSGLTQSPFVWFTKTGLNVSRTGTLLRQESCFDVDHADRRRGPAMIRRPIYTLHRRQWVPRGLFETFGFFERPQNLPVITPPWLAFSILTPEPIAMARGLIIDYRVRVLRLPTHWRTLVSEYDPPHGFRDVQVIGPYRLWDHRHRFWREGGGTVIEDFVVYEAAARTDRVPAQPARHPAAARGDLRLPPAPDRGPPRRVRSAPAGPSGRGLPVSPIELIEPPESPGCQRAHAVLAETAPAFRAGGLDRPGIGEPELIDRMAGDPHADPGRGGRRDRAGRLRGRCAGAFPEARAPGGTR